MLKPLHITRGIAVLKEEKHSAHHPLWICGEDGNIYITKTEKSSEARHLTLISELIAHHFLSLWNLHTPPVAGVYLSPELIRYDSSLSENQSVGLYNGVICFASRVVSGAVDFTRILDNGHYWSYRSLTQPDHFLKIGLFDLWLANTSRTMDETNLLFRLNPGGKLDIYAIDHSRICQGLIEINWDKGFHLPKGTTILQSHLAGKIEQRLSRHWKHQDWKTFFHLAIDRCRDEFEDIIGLIPPSVRYDRGLISDLKSFLFDVSRNELVLDDFWNRLKR